MLVHAIGLFQNIGQQGLIHLVIKNIVSNFGFGIASNSCWFIKYCRLVQIANEWSRCGQVLYEILFLMKNGLCLYQHHTSGIVIAKGLLS